MVAPNQLEEVLKLQENILCKGCPKKTATFEIIELDLNVEQVYKRDLIGVFGHQ